MFIGTFIQWSAARQVLVDQQGLMLPKAAIDALEKAIAIHRQHSSEELKEIGKASVAAHHPELKDSFNEKYFD
jgi:hypothetical protein